MRRALQGANVIAGVWLEEAGQKLNIYEALKKDLLQPDVAVALLKAQAGTGHIIDPVTSAWLTVDEAMHAGLVGPELHEKLLSAEKTVTGYRDPYSEQSVSLSQALKKFHVMGPEAKIDAVLTPVLPMLFKSIPQSSPTGLSTSDFGPCNYSEEEVYSTVAISADVPASSLQEHCHATHAHEVGRTHAAATPLLGASIGCPLWHQPVECHGVYLPMRASITMKKDLIVRDHDIRLLESQIATGGIIDPVHSHRVPVDVAYQRGYFDEEMNRILADPSDDTKGFFDPNTHENLLQLLERCVEDPETGLCLLPLTDKSAKGGKLVYTNTEAHDVFEKATISAPLGKFQGKTVTINSEYFTAEQCQDLLQHFHMGHITVKKTIKIVITVVEEHERKGQLCFEGLRALVPAAGLLETATREPSVQEMAEADSMRWALGDSNAIAGVWLEKAGQKLIIYEALKKDLLQPDVAVAMLETQAGTGHIIDTAISARLTVDKAVHTGL
ncbi:hypothetical protein A6R68_23950, partial [Neotoma lepida]